MSAPRVTVDFVNRRAPATLAGAVLLLLGIGAATAAYLEYRALEARRAGLELKLQAAARHARHDAALDPRVGEIAGRVAQELGTPWTRLLAELEAASRDSSGEVAVLSIEPDHAKHDVHITGESRDLPRILAYLQRLQASTLLRYPMLDRHEVRTDDPQRPVRFAMTAEWREMP